MPGIDAVICIAAGWSCVSYHHEDTIDLSVQTQGLKTNIAMHNQFRKIEDKPNMRNLQD